MFPSDEAKDISAMSKEELLKIKRVILIDSTWSQTKYYLRQPILKNVQHVKIMTEKTLFWRYQKGEADTSLATVEALYFFFRDFETTLYHKGDYEQYVRSGGIWDNLLYYFVFNYKLIQHNYKQGNLKDQAFRRIPGFIRYDESDPSAKREQDLHTGCWKDRNLKFRLLPNGKKIPIEHEDQGTVDVQNSENTNTADRKRDTKSNQKEKNKS